MPYINTTTTEKITPDKEAALREAFGKAIELIPGKSEEWLMLNFTAESHMAFRGNGSAPTAMLEVEILGKAPSGSFDKLTPALCDIVSEVLSVPKDRIYVKYREVECWGYNGINF
ncbi:MAG: hypothetical protein IJX38_05175 [Clostridia bacterium]|nr:hypothetical protein [Clostridia bacterium]